jgi:predicted metallo-beta-lactamase superfamily hydrolase
MFNNQSLYNDKVIFVKNIDEMIDKIRMVLETNEYIKTKKEIKDIIEFNDHFIPLLHSIN